MAPDFSVGCLQFRSGIVARLTSGLAAPKDRSLTIIGDKGSIVVRDLWDNRSAVYLEELGRAAQAVDAILGDPPGDAAEDAFCRGSRTAAGACPIPPARANPHLPGFPSQIDFCAGIAAQAKPSQPASGRSSRATAPCTSPRSHWR